MIKQMFILTLLVSGFTSCSSNKDFIITDEHVDKEINTGKSHTAKPVYNTVLSDADRKYFADKLGVKPADILNEKLYNFVKAWEGTKYVYGGENRKGIDCSALMRELYSYVYDRKLPRTAAEMALDKRVDLFKVKENLREGDLVFFRITDEKIISHVGIYLKNGKFFSANQYGGTEISSLKHSYWKKNFITAGRFQETIYGG